MRNRSIPYPSSCELDRRSFLKYSVLGCAGWALGSSIVRTACATEPKLASSRPVVATTSGFVRGYLAEGINTFKGIPYGASTAAANRFMGPREAISWSGVREAIVLGPQAPQQAMEEAIAKAPLAERPAMETFKSMFRGVWETDPAQSEDCLVLNVWSPALDAGKRPVMVWLHGGGLTNGSGGAPWYDGTQLARNNGVVCVTVNHRLNALGYLYLGQLGGARYADSGNAGILDLVAALKWVRNNISSFGGDPNNVTIYGQSGGGWKVHALMAMPAAKGLFHKAIVQSAPTLRAATPAEATDLAKSVLANLGLRQYQVDRLQSIPTAALIAALPADAIMKYRPVVDGRSLLTQPLEPAAILHSRDVPLLIGTVQQETQELNQSALTLDEASLRTRVASMIGGDATAAQRLIASYRQRHSNASPGDLWTILGTDYRTRLSATVEAEDRLRQNCAPVYMYIFAWRSTFMDGIFKTPHNTELPFVFDNIHAARGLVGAFPDAQTAALARNMSSAWAAFARTGNPNGGGLPYWAPYRLADRATMLLDRSSELVRDPEKEDRIAMEPLVRGA
jgi:para-nitrobenzyl esterase